MIPPETGARCVADSYAYAYAAAHGSPMNIKGYAVLNLQTHCGPECWRFLATASNATAKS